MTQVATRLTYLADLWDEKVASNLDQPELLRYRSNLLGSDLRITNFGGGNTSSKLEHGSAGREGKEILWVKGSGGDLGSIKRAGFATLYMDKLLALEKAIGASIWKTRWWICIRCVRLGIIRWRLRSIRRCMGFCRFRMWTICTRTGGSRWRPRRREDQDGGVQSGVRAQAGWLPWQRPGFELGMMLKRLLQESGVRWGGAGWAWAVYVGRYAA